MISYKDIAPPPDGANLDRVRESGDFIRMCISLLCDGLAPDLDTATMKGAVMARQVEEVARRVKMFSPDGLVKPFHQYIRRAAYGFGFLEEQATFSHVVQAQTPYGMPVRIAYTSARTLDQYTAATHVYDTDVKLYLDLWACRASALLLVGVYRDGRGKPVVFPAVIKHDSDYMKGAKKKFNTMLAHYALVKQLEQ